MDETRSSNRAQVSRPLVVAAAVLLVIGAAAGATAVARGSDDGEVASESPSSAAPAEPGASPSPTRDDPADGSTRGSTGDTTGAPATDPGLDFDPQVRAALRDHFPALVPSRVPPGWRVTRAAYRGTGSPRWSMTLQSPQGDPVVLHQSRVSLADAVAGYLPAGATVDGQADLSRFGTGSWGVYAAEGDFVALTKTLPDTTAVVSGPDQDTVLVLVRQLLVSEDARGPAASEG